MGLIPKAHQPIPMDGTLTHWDGAFVTPVHVGHPDFANRGGQFLFLWDEQNLYIGLRCLDQHPAHVGTDHQIWNGDAVEFYLDTRRGKQLGAASFGPGTLHMFWTPFTKTTIQPRMGVRDLPAFKGFKLRGAEVAGAKTPWGYTAVFKLPWTNFPNFVPKAGEVIGIDCELCSSDGGPRVDRTFVYSGPDAVRSPAAFGRVQLVDKMEPDALRPLGRVLLPLALTKSANYPWLYGTAGISPTIAKAVATIEGNIIDSQGKVRKTTTGSRRTLAGSGFALWTGRWELFDLPPGVYTVAVTAFDKDGNIITSRSDEVRHDRMPTNPAGRGITVLIEDVGKYLKQPDVPKRRGSIRFIVDGKIKVKDGKRVIQASYLPSYNGFCLGYVLTSVLKADKRGTSELHANDFTEITIRYTDDWLDSQGLTERDVPGLIEQLKDPANKVRFLGAVVPGGEMLEFSPPMKKLMLLGAKARRPLQDRLGDERIQNEVALILGAIGDEMTVPALIHVYPTNDLRKAEFGSPEYLKGVCLTFSLTYLTGQPIGRSRWGADLHPENKKLWEDWWAKVGKTFKVPAQKPNATWAPSYPVLSQGWAAKCRKEFVKSEPQHQAPSPQER